MDRLDSLLSTLYIVYPTALTLEPALPAPFSFIRVHLLARLLSRLIGSIPPLYIAAISLGLKDFVDCLPRCLCFLDHSPVPYSPDDVAAIYPGLQNDPSGMIVSELRRICQNTHTTIYIIPPRISNVPSAAFHCQTSLHQYQTGDLPSAKSENSPPKVSIDKKTQSAQGQTHILSP
jgi:hypothetical protein